MHVGCLQIATKPMHKRGLDNSIFICFRDDIDNDFHESLVGVVETSFSKAPNYFSYFHDISICLKDQRQDLLLFSVKLHGYKIRPGAILAVLVYKIHCRLCDSTSSKVFKSSSKK